MNFLKKIMVEIVNVLFAIIVAVLFFTMMRDYVLQPFQVEGNSMQNELQNQDQMLMLRQTAVERFDVVVFPDPRGSGSSYVKRVIGLPGDNLYFMNDTLYLNNQALQEPYLSQELSENQELFTQDFSLWDTLGIQSIPEGYYFVMGDNRPFSGDSRQFGLVPIDSIQGEANFIYYPFNRWGQLDSYTLNEEANQIIQRQE